MISFWICRMNQGSICAIYEIPVIITERDCPNSDSTRERKIGHRVKPGDDAEL